MDITEADLEAVQAVLTGKVTPVEAATGYSTAQKVLLAHTALAAGNFDQPAWKGQLGEMLSELTIAAAIPEADWPHGRHGYPEAPDWYFYEEFRLVPTSKRLGLHHGDRAGNYLHVKPADQIRRLLEDEQCRQAALTLFEAAIAKVNARRAAELSYNRRVRQLKAAAKKYPSLTYFLNEQSLFYTNQPAKWAEIHQTLGELLREYFPELLSK